MSRKVTVDDLALFGGNALFSTPKSTSNLLQPDFEKFINYSKPLFDPRIQSGSIVKLLEQRLAAFHQTEYCVTFCSGFWAIALAISALAIKGRTEIVMPSLTYRRMADIAAWVKLKPHFCEVDPKTLAMNEATARACINDDTALILAAHPIVNCCDIDGLVSLAKEKNIPLLFDSVESVYESTASGKIGKFGNAEAFSIHACKLLNGFGGGYLTTNDGALTTQLVRMRDGSDINYTSISNGMNARLNEMHAAMALAALDDIDKQVSLNRDRYHTYKHLFATIPDIRLVEFDERYQTGYKNIVVELLDEWPLSRSETVNLLNAENILARVYYSPPLHRKPMTFPHVDAVLPVTDRLAKRYLNLPCGQLVTERDIEDIVWILHFIHQNANAIAERIQT